ncbi:hypothetical protein [Klebsiella quasipneumoniae]|uniref:hypothetical protein n=1 Tax=Klebsiella quasipneumoniae TaxID=1463165 RepID=UPI003753F2DE
MMSLWDALRMNMMISYQELVRTFPNTDVCIKMLRALEARGGRGYGGNTGECIEIKTREPLSSVMETLNEGG